MAHPLNEQLSKRLSQSHGTAVGPRPPIRRLSMTLLLSLVLTAPLAHAQSVVDEPPVQFSATEQPTRAATPSLWFSKDTGLDVQRFAQDMKQAGYSPGQAFAAQNWINRLASPTFMGSKSLVGDALNNGLEDRAQWSNALFEAVHAGPAAFHLWENKIIDAMDVQIQSAVGGDFNKALVVLEYFDGLGVHPIEAMALINEGGWGNDHHRWEELAESAQHDQFELPKTSVGGKRALIEAIDAAGLRFVRAPATVLSQPNAMGRMATMINEINGELSVATGMKGQVLGLNGRVSWDMATPRGTGDDVEGFTTEHNNGIMIRAAPRQDLIHHEFYHGLNYAMDPSTGRAPGHVTDHVVQLWNDLRQLDLGEHAPQIEAERWEGLRKLATQYGISDSTWKKLSSPESGGMSVQELAKVMCLDLVDRDKLDYLVANLHVLHVQSGKGVSFIDYRTAIFTEFGNANPLSSISYYLDKEETLAYRTQSNLSGANAASTHHETWVAPTPTEAKMQQSAMEGFYADARAWQQQDLTFASKVNLEGRLAARRASQETLADMGMSARAINRP